MIEIKNVCAGYGKENVLRDICLDIHGGKIMSVIGPNGSGKSTLLKSIVRIIAPVSGEILIEGTKSDELSHRDVAKKIAYLAQGRNVPDMTVEQMVLHGRFPHLNYPRRYSKEDRKIATDAMKRTGVEKFSGKSLCSLSGGMKQSAYIAMALAQNTDYILLDEPTTYLDVSNQLNVMKILKKLAGNGKGIVTVMHDLPLAFSFSDIIVVLKEGNIIACDTPKKLSTGNVLKEALGVELKLCENSYYYKF